MVNILERSALKTGVFNWRRLLVAVAGIEVSLLAVLVVAQRDLLALALGLIILTGLALWLGRARLGAARLPVRGWLGAGWGVPRTTALDGTRPRCAMSAHASGVCGQPCAV